MSRVKDDPSGLLRRLLAKVIGTGLLVTVVVGSGIAGERLSPQDTGLQLLENSTATVFGLAVLILMFGPVSGAHFTPVVTVADWFLGRRMGTGLPGSLVGPYLIARVVGGIAGAVLAMRCSICRRCRSPAPSGRLPRMNSRKLPPRLRRTESTERRVWQASDRRRRQ